MDVGEFSSEGAARRLGQQGPACERDCRQNRTRETGSSSTPVTHPVGSASGIAHRSPSRRYPPAGGLRFDAISSPATASSALTGASNNGRSVLTAQATPKRKLL
jgi:hypothetical protein